MDTRVREQSLDPVTLEVIRNALPAISTEMAVDLVAHLNQRLPRGDS